MKAIVVGGGIGGLTTAIALQAKGIEVEVYEAATEFGEVGAGIWVAPNAMKIYERLGLSNDIKEAGYAYKRGVGISTYSGEVLGEMQAGLIKEKHGHYTTAIHRARLHEILIQQTHSATPGKRLARYEETEDEVKAHFEDGTTATGDILIGADGIKSVIRSQMLGDVSYRYTGQTCWRLLTKFPLDFGSFDMMEIWGNVGGLRVGSGRINVDMVYTFITAKRPKGETDNPETLKDDLKTLCQAYPNQIHDLIEATPTDKILRNDLYDFKPIHQWHKGRVVLVGDAAHATTPNMGQGACQAIESGYVLAHMLSEAQNIEEAFSRYQAMRIKKAHKVTNMSWQMGKMVDIHNPLGRWFRNLILKWAPASSTQKMQDQLYNLPL